MLNLAHCNHMVKKDNLYSIDYMVIKSVNQKNYIDIIEIINNKVYGNNKLNFYKKRKEGKKHG